MDIQDDNAILKLILEESCLDFCSADGTGRLCCNYGEFYLICNHNVCIIHKDFYNDTQICYACEASEDKSARKIQRWFKTQLIKIRLRQLVVQHQNNEAKKKSRDLQRKYAREKFLRRFDK